MWSKPVCLQELLSVQSCCMQSAYSATSLPTLWLLLALSSVCLASQLFSADQLLLPSLCHTGLLLPAGWAEVWWSCWWDLHTGWSTAGWGYLHASLGGLQCVYNVMAWGCHTTDASSLSDVCCLPIPANTSCQSWVAATITSSCSCTCWFGWDLLGPNAGVFTSDLVTHHYWRPGVLSWLCDVNSTCNDLRKSHWLNALKPLRQTRADTHAVLLGVILTCCQNSSTTYCCSVSSNQVELTW